jgi:hypothetical protein
MNITVIKEDRYDLPGGDVLISLNELSPHIEYTYVITPKCEPLTKYFWADHYGYKYEITDVIIRPDLIKFQDVIVTLSEETKPIRYHIYPKLIVDWKTN